MFFYWQIFWPLAAAGGGGTSDNIVFHRGGNTFLDARWGGGVSPPLAHVWVIWESQPPAAEKNNRGRSLVQGQGLLWFTIYRTHQSHI